MVGLLAQILSLYHTFISFDPPLFFLSHSLFQTISHLLSYNTVYFPFSITHNIFILRGYCTYKSSYYRSNNLSYLHTFSVPVISIKLYSQSHTLTLRSSYSHFVCLSLSLSLSLYLSLSHLSFSIRHTLPPPLLCTISIPFVRATFEDKLVAGGDKTGLFLFSDCFFE